MRVWRPWVVLLLAACGELSEVELDPLTRVRLHYGLPGIALGELSPDGTIEVQVSGRRRADSDDPLLVSDALVLGSCTKAMTATLFALSGDSGLTWDTTVAEAFPHVGDLHVGFRNVTLEELLVHHGGAHSIDTYIDEHQTLFDEIWGSEGDARANRAWYAEQILGLGPEPLPGDWAYSNEGYLLVAAALEAALGMSWEAAMSTRLFAPLDMTSCAFGPPATVWGHEAGVPQDGTELQNWRAWGPVGTVHCNMEDWARFASAHLFGTPELDEAARERMHMPWPTAWAGTGYGHGWFVGDNRLGGIDYGAPRWTDNPSLLSHGGNVPGWTAYIWLEPDLPAALVAATNAGVGLGTSFPALWQAIQDGIEARVAEVFE